MYLLKARLISTTNIEMAFSFLSLRKQFKVIGYLHNILCEKNRISLNTVKSQFCIKHRQTPDNEHDNIIPV